MYILGINQGHNATACLLKDGKILGCVSEERFSRIKNHFGIPFKSIEWLLKEGEIKLKDVDYFVFDDAYPFRENGFSQPNSVFERFKNKKFKEKIKTFLANKSPKFYIKMYEAASRLITPKKRFQKKLKDKISLTLKIPKEKIILINHHLMHALSTCYNLPSNEKTLIFTLDGEGSNLSATVNIWDGGEMKIISKSSKYDSLGYLYTIATIFLGMKPLEHEFKVMGLAPYAKENKSEEVYRKIKRLFYVDSNLVLHCKYPAMFLDYYFLKEMKYVRFDNIAAAVQKLVEEITTEWVTRAVKKTNIKNIALSGGVFMNVKANQKISNLPFIKNIFVMPSAGDESNAMGACLYGYLRYCKEKNIPKQISPIKDLYLGPEYNNKYIEETIKKGKFEKSFLITKHPDINKIVAKLLAKGEIVARCSGKSEWGARALGNRSILSNPHNKDTIRILNESIKDRDFWMPFTPSVLDTFEKKYIKNPKKIFAPYMAITFDSKESAKEDLPAAMHPYDFTIRPQIVTKEFNKDYYSIIEEFSKLTGIGAILNTSFNLHGEPNVLTPEDAIRTVEKSGLNYLSMGNYLFKKK